MQEFRGQFIEAVRRTAAVRSFRFRLRERLDFLPGQFVQVIFDEEDRNNLELNKFLSFSCAPGKDYIEVTKKISDSQFSRALEQLSEGGQLLFKGPLGACVFDARYDKIAFLIGGIGITPVISILEHIVQQGLVTSSCLLYSNLNAEQIAFREELEAWAKQNSRIKVVHTLTEPRSQDQGYFQGRIDKNLLTSQIGDYRERVFFIFGPPRMVEAMQGLCLELGCDREKIKTEDFIGY